MGLKAVAKIHDQQYSQALTHLQSIDGLESNDKDLQEIKELAHLAQARIFFELKDYAKAQNAYQEIPRNSPYFADSVYEIAHSYVGKAQAAENPETRTELFQSALNALDLLLLFVENEKIQAEASILKANILLLSNHHFERPE